MPKHLSSAVVSMLYFRWHHDLTLEMLSTVSGEFPDEYWATATWYTGPAVCSVAKHSSLLSWKANKIKAFSITLHC